ncbi:thiolase family protein [Sphingobium sp. Sx8-8]|uniref:thiolase family protein n=1 Tax=Sphingobium sp. Sx8-8 TaxID=2933617 RepID=UPI001F58C6BC|nr:thiolase family protein [Sphingobium sp. Sx8-8]
MAFLNEDIAIVGVGTTDFAAQYKERDPSRTSYSLGIDALKQALDDSGLELSDIDGLLCSRMPSYERIGDLVNLRHVRVVNGYEGSGRMAGVVIQHAAALIAAGLATTVACIYGNNGRSAAMTYGGAGAGTPDHLYYDLAYGMTSPGAYVGMMYQRYASIYGAPDGALAPLAISNRKNAALNPIAVMKEQITEEEYLAARYIADPLRLYDYCMINDGGAAIIVTTKERAKNLKKRPVLISASASSGDLTNFYTKPDFFDEASRFVADKVYAQSGLTPDQMDCVQIYDNFTPIMLFSLESFGFAPRGEGWQWIRDGRIELNGEMPINTSGGHTAEGYMQGWALQIEAVRQLRGEAGARQVSDCEIAQYICVSPIVTSHILRRG